MFSASKGSTGTLVLVAIDNGCDAVAVLVVIDLSVFDVHSGQTSATVLAVVEKCCYRPFYGLDVHTCG